MLWKLSSSSSLFVPDCFCGICPGKQQAGLGRKQVLTAFSFFFSSAVAAGRAQVQQEPSAETTEGTGISINCSHPTIQTNDFIYWYRQLPGRGPAFIVSIHKGTKDLQDPPGRLSVAADRRSSALWLSRPRRGDAAVYYCALGDTSNWKITFGSGTQLMVKPHVTPSPSVYRLISKDDEDLEICLITDYSPEDLTLNWTDKDTKAVVEVATSENKQEVSYLSTYWAKKDKMQCGANHKGFGELEGEDPESGASTVCVTGLSLHFRTDENLNMLSLSQLGLKIILMKGIIFNVLMTMLMWKKKSESNQTVQS
ncbi:T cell receptor alpha chain MC.7.G5-like [Spheniscus humboldti]